MITYGGVNNSTFQYKIRSRGHIATSINDLLDSVILVGELINCLMFNSEAKFSNDKPSGFFCKRLQFKSLRIITGLLSVKAKVDEGFKKSLKQET